MSSDQKIDASSLLVTTIKGVGEKFSHSLLRLGIKTVEDLLFHFPTGYQDRTTLKKLNLVLLFGLAFDNLRPKFEHFLLGDNNLQ